MFEQSVVEEDRFDGASAVIRQHFEDFYGTISPAEIERLMMAERVVLHDVAERYVHRALLNAWRDGVDGPVATSLLAYQEAVA